MGCLLFVLQSCLLLSMTVLGTGKKQTYRVSLPTSFLSRSDCCFRYTSACYINEIMRGTDSCYCAALWVWNCVSISRACDRLGCADQGEIRQQEWESPGSDAPVLLIYLLLPCNTACSCIVVPSLMWPPFDVCDFRLCWLVAGLFAVDSVLCWLVCCWFSFYFSLIT
jgi:hypothetical protein